MKFVHIADIHFDCPFTSLSKIEGLSAKRRIDQRKALKKVIEYIKEENIPLLFIAGDLYEHEYIKLSTIEYINNLFKEIPKTRIFISPGNHDPILKDSYYNKFQWNENVHIFNSKIERISLEKLDIYGYGFDDFYCRNSKIEEINIEKKEKINILITHASLNDNKQEEMQYNSISTSDLNKIGFDYVALGHIHKTNYRESKKIIYSGSIISLGFDELEEHGMVVGEIEKENLKIDFIKLDENEYYELKYDISNIYTEEELIEGINNLEIEENKLIKVELIGNKNFEINLYNINKLISKENIIKIKDSTKNGYNLSRIAEENSLKGIFVKEILKELEKSDEKEIVLDAIQIGLDALER